MTSLLATQLFGDYDEEFEKEAAPRGATEEPIPARKNGETGRREETGQTDRSDGSEDKTDSEGDAVTRKRGAGSKIDTHPSTKKKVHRGSKTLEEIKRRRFGPSARASALPRSAGVKRGWCEEKHPKSGAGEWEGSPDKTPKLGYRKWKVGVFELGFALVPIVKEKQ